ncbi:MAG: hypothetical protein NTY69_09140 [Methylococcales bacterium]|nr:hypothetical protein [Methylococcales bacterium]
MIARFGSTEMACLCNYIGITTQKNRVFDYIKGITKPWWWEPKIINQMQQWSGFFPTNTDKIEQFCELMLQDIPEVDVLGTWLEDEKLFEQELKNSQKIFFELLNPYFSKTPWTKALEGKKVLVVHPFARTIEQQYKKRDLLFKNDLLPQFELITLKAVQSLAGNSTEFSNWFVALDYMKAEIDKQDYDICLIGCGAYGFPLAAHVKRQGKKSVHLGGSLQLLFGISGKRWENVNYNNQFNYAQLINEHWVKPAEEEKPPGAINVEGACYW